MSLFKCKENIKLDQIYFKLILKLFDIYATKIRVFNAIKLLA
jgi:hypothetical protein